MPNVQLIPFHVKGITENTFEVPRGIRMIRARSIWREGFKGENIVVAVIDTGCQPDHLDLMGQIIGGYNFTGDYNGNPANFSDNNGHGTHVCGTIAAAENGFGVVGAAPKAKLLVLKALNGSGEGTTDNISSAIQYAINWTGPRGEKVRVISMSLGGPNDDPALHSSIKNAVQANIMVVCAAGNEGDGIADTVENSYPAAYPEVVAVGSVNQRGRISRFSNSNGEVDLVAPGEQVVSTFPGNQFAVLSGTSMAVPHVSGAVALLIDKYETIRGHKLTELEAYNELLNQTVSLGNPETQEGHGLLKLNHQKVEKLKELLTGFSLRLENS
ncbi:S8 family peptidase [Peribacillus sp. JNUCC 23]|uniref:S8 family peptidase n=1 Tax=Peribacillus sp. NPDC096379 TaxID=3364393 RepID=UPI0038260E86